MKGLLPVALERWSPQFSHSLAVEWSHDSPVSFALALLRQMTLTALTTVEKAWSGYYKLNSRVSTHETNLVALTTTWMHDKKQLCHY